VKLRQKELERAAAVSIDQDHSYEKAYEKRLEPHGYAHSAALDGETEESQQLECRIALASSSTAGSIIMSPAVKPRRKRKSHHQWRREREWKKSFQIPTPTPYDL